MKSLEARRTDPPSGRHGGADKHLPAPAAEHHPGSRNAHCPAARAAGPSTILTQLARRGLTAFVRPGRGGPRLYYLTLGRGASRRD